MIFPRKLQANKIFIPTKSKLFWRTDLSCSKFFTVRPRDHV
eukprot:UN27160